MFSNKDAVFAKKLHTTPLDSIGYVGHNVGRKWVKWVRVRAKLPVYRTTLSREGLKVGI